MDRIPPEILSSIICCLKASPTRTQPISLYATVCRKWQQVVECLTFSSLELAGTDLDDFQAATRGDNIIRRGYVRSISVRCANFKNRTRGCCEVTRTIDLEADTEAWKHSIFDVFSILATMSILYEAEIGTPPAISLTLLPALRGNGQEGRHLMDVPKRCNEAEHTTREVEAARPMPGTIHLRASHLLPLLPHVSSLECHGWGQSRYLSPNWIGQIAKKLPHLQNLSLYLEDPYDWGCDLRKKYQQGLANSFDEVNSDLLLTWSMKVWTHELKNEDVPVHQLSTPGLGDHIYDRFLRRLSTFYKLRFLYLTGPLTVSPALFQLPMSEFSDTIFPSLEEFALEFTPATSDGRWFYLRDDQAFQDNSKIVDGEEEDSEDSGDNSIYDDEDHYERDEDDIGWVIYGRSHVRERKVSNRNKYRSLPNEETFTPFLRSAAEMCSRMPKVKQFSLKLNNNNYMCHKQRLDYEFVDRVFELWFLSANKILGLNKIIQIPVIPLDTRISTHNRVYFRTGNYEPRESILRSWREVIGPGGKVILLDEVNCSYISPAGSKKMLYTGDVLREI